MSESKLASGVLQIAKHLPKDARSIALAADEKDADVVPLRSIISQVVKTASDRFGSSVSASATGSGSSSSGGVASLSRSLTDGPAGDAKSSDTRMQSWAEFNRSTLLTEDAPFSDVTLVRVVVRFQSS